ncbi:MAG: hypothetical protein KDC54_02985 [Lewinella sp.]|nr:hypothetical protein [Lewinella sp.]
MHYVLFAALILLLTLLTQTGGLLLLLALLINWYRPRRRGRLTYFLLLYGLSWLVTPWLAGAFGRTHLPLWATEQAPLQPQNWLLILTNRHYVRPALKETTLAVARDMREQYPGLTLTYLDANFPFFNGFPLWPHRSHDDGEKLDLAFVYQHGEQRTTRAPGLLGYGRCDGPEVGEVDYPARCREQGYWPYNMLRLLARPLVHGDYRVDEAFTAQLVRRLARSGNIGKIFIEPHLKQRWGLGQLDKVRFQGCAAVRHDDHIHVQL